MNLQKMTIVLGFALLFVQVPSQAQSFFTPEDADSIQSFPLNEFFIYSPSGDRYSRENTVCVKVKEDPIEYYELLDAYHGVECELIYTEDGQEVLLWNQVQQPSRYYKLHSVSVLETRENGYYILQFQTYRIDRKVSRLKNKSKIGAGVYDLSYLQRILNDWILGEN